MELLNPLAVQDVSLSPRGIANLKRKAKQFGYNLVNVKEHELLTTHLQI